jgi:hypothetical protein
MFLQQGGGRHSVSPVSMRCPYCRHVGTFGGIHEISDMGFAQQVGATAAKGGGGAMTSYAAGIRVCPNQECRGLVFIVTSNGSLTASYPPEVIDFDSTNLPASIQTTLEEAIKCHAAGCFKASALMIRRVLEELCEDKDAKGNTLKARLAALGTTIVLPTGLLAAADELRLLGNDAAHVEAKDYDAIGKEEVEIALDLAKELLKAVYQLSSIVARLQALKKP